MSAAPHFFNQGPLLSPQESFNRLVRGLPSELNIAALQLQADVSYHEMFEYMEEMRKEGKPFSDISLNLYHEAKDNYQELINACVKLIGYYRRKLDTAKLDKAELDRNIQAYRTSLSIINHYCEKIIRPNYEQLQKIPQVILRSLYQQAVVSYNEAFKIQSLTEHYIIPVEDYKAVFEEAIKAHTTLLIYLKTIAENIEASEKPDKEKLQGIVQQHQRASENLIVLEYYLEEYRQSQEKLESETHDNADTYTSSDQDSSSGSEEECGLYDSEPETAPNAQGSSSDSQEEFSSESPDYTADSPADTEQDTKMSQSNGKSPAFFNENQSPAKGNAHKAAATLNPPRP